MGVFDAYKDSDVKDAEGFGKTPNMNEKGRYLCRIRRHVLGKSRANEGEIKFVAEYEIVRTANDKHPKGARRSLVVKLNPSDKKKSSSKLGAIKAHLEAVSGTPQSEIDRAFFDHLENNPYEYADVLVWNEVGDQIDLDTSGPVTDKTKRPFTPQNWYPYEESEDEEEGEDSTKDQPAAEGKAPF